MENTCSLASLYALKRGLTTSAGSACFSARAMGIALRTPYLRTS